MSETVSLEPQTPEFADAKLAYFTNTAKQLLTPLRMHQAQGLWNRNEDGERDWGNVTGHCLAEAARAEIFADLLGFDEELKHDLFVAAGVHDFYKKDEIMKLRANNTSWDAYAEAQVEAHAILEASGIFTPRQIWLATAVGHETALEAELLSQKEELEPEEMAWLVMHYVDDYTIDDTWVEPATTDEDGNYQNAFDKRMDIVVNVNAIPGGKYHGIQQAGYEHFGEPTYNVQYRAGLAVQERLAQLIGDRTGQSIEEPKLLPEIVDRILVRVIEND